MGLSESSPTLKSPFKLVTLSVQISVRKEAIAAEDPVTTRRLRWLQNLADAFEVIRSPLLRNLLLRVGSLFLDHAVEVPKSGFARPRSNSERVTV